MLTNKLQQQIAILLFWLIEADVFQIPQLHKHYNVILFQPPPRALQQPVKLNPVYRLVLITHILHHYHLLQAFTYYVFKFPFVPLLIDCRSFLEQKHAYI